MGRRSCLLLALLALTQTSPLVAAAPVGAVAQGSTPASAEACTVEPRSVDELLALWYDPSGTPIAPPLPTLQVAEEADFPPGEPADAATIAEIDGVARAWVACDNGVDPLQYYALLTDDLAQEQGPRFIPREEARAVLADRSPTPPELASVVGPAQQVRVLPDGRVGAVFVYEEQALGAQNIFIVLERQDGDWRLDEVSYYVAMEPRAPVSGFRVVAEYPHDTEASTQGLVYVDDILYEGTGSGNDIKLLSMLRRVDLETGEVEQSVTLDASHFGEGIAVVGDRIYQLTWQTQTCFVYDRETFELIETFTYQTQGWGLTTDGERLIMSDGSNRLVFRDPETFAELGTVDVRDGDLPVSRLNELEYVDGEVWANVYQTDRIVRIDPATGGVTGWIDLPGLLSPEKTETAGVLNGIAYDPESGRVFVTGKLWPTLFEIEVLPPS